MAQTLAARLASIETAITAIEAGAQSYAIGDRQYTRGTLATLYKERRELIKEIAEESAVGNAGSKRTLIDF